MLVEHLESPSPVLLHVHLYNLFSNTVETPPVVAFLLYLVRLTVASLTRSLDQRYSQASEGIVERTIPSLHDIDIHSLPHTNTVTAFW